MIMGSQMAVISGGGGSLELPRKGLEVVGIAIIGTAVAQIQISPGRQAVFVGGGSSYTFSPVSFVAENGVVDFTWGNSGSQQATLIVFYGKSEKGTPPLSAYSGVMQQLSFGLAASVSSFTSVTVNANFNFPAAATEITGAEIGYLQIPSTVTYSGPMYVSIPLSSGAMLYLPLSPNASLGNALTYGSVSVPDYPNSTGIFPLSIPVTSTVPVTGTVTYTNSGTTAFTVAAYVVLYYR